MNRSVRLILALTLGSVALLAAAACGTDGGAASSADTGDGATALSAYRDCLSKQGIDLPEPPSGQAAPNGRPSGRPSDRPSGSPSGRPSAFPSGRPGGGLRPEGVDEETWQKAQTACASVMPTGAPGGAGNRGGGTRQADAAYRTCLSDHGVTGTQAEQTADPKVAAAIKACEVLRPSAKP